MAMTVAIEIRLMVHRHKICRGVPIEIGVGRIDCLAAVEHNFVDGQRLVRRTVVGIVREHIRQVARTTVVLIQRGHSLDEKQGL